MSYIKTEATNLDLSYWASRPYLRPETQERIRNTEVVLVPREQFRSHSEPSFPVRTEDFFRFLKNSLVNIHTVDIAIEDDNYQELALHSALIDLGAVVVTTFVAPIIVNVISEYIKRRAEGLADQNSMKIQFKITIAEQTTDSSRAVQISFDGPATEFPSAMEKAIADTLQKVIVQPSANSSESIHESQ